MAANWGPHTPFDLYRGRKTKSLLLYWDYTRYCIHGQYTSFYPYKNHKSNWITNTASARCSVFHCSLAVWFHNHLCGGLPTGPSTGAAQQHRRDQTGRLQVCHTVATPTAFPSQRHWYVKSTIVFLMIVCSVVKIMFYRVKASGTVFWRPSASCPSSPTPLSSPLPRTLSLALFMPTSMDRALDRVAQGRGEQGLVSEIHWAYFKQFGSVRVYRGCFFSNPHPGVWWATSTPVSPSSGCLTLKRGHSPGPLES